MNKSELIARLEGHLGGRSAAAAALDSVLGEITRAVAAGERVTLTGFGTFERVERPARTGRNPRTGEPLELAASATPKFHPGAALRSAVAGTTVPDAAVARTTPAAPTTTPPGARGSRAAAASAPSGAVRRVRSAVRRVPAAVTPPASSDVEAAGTSSKHATVVNPAKSKAPKSPKDGKSAKPSKKSAKAAKASGKKKKK